MLDANPLAALYFCAVVMLAMHFWSNLFISSLVDNFNRIATARGASPAEGPLATASQRRWMQAIEIAHAHYINRWQRRQPKQRWRRRVHRFVTHWTFGVGGWVPPSEVQARP